MRAKQYLCFNNNIISGEDLKTVKCIYPPSPGGKGCCLFEGSGSVVLNSLFCVPTITCGGSVFGHRIVMHYFVSFLVVQ